MEPEIILSIYKFIFVLAFGLLMLFGGFYVLSLITEYYKRKEKE